MKKNILDFRGKVPAQSGNGGFKGRKDEFHDAGLTKQAPLSLREERKGPESIMFGSSFISGLLLGALCGKKITAEGAEVPAEGRRGVFVSMHFSLRFSASSWRSLR